MFVEYARKVLCTRFFLSKSFTVKTDLNAHIKFVHEKPTSCKGIPAENMNNISFELNYDQPVNNDSFEGETGEATNWTSQDEVEKKRLLEKQLEEWMVSQGLKISGDRAASGSSSSTYIPNVPKILEHVL